MKRMIILATLAATMALMLALAGPASANITRIGPFEETGALVADCGDFEVLADLVVDGQIDYFDTDRDGIPDFFTLRVRLVSFFYNSATGKGFTAYEHGNFTFDLSNDALVIETGVTFRVTVPGEGVVLLDAGRVEYDEETGDVVFVAGPHQLLEGDTAKLCAALAPNQDT
jgi:hypothetical protein